MKMPFEVGILEYKASQNPKMLAVGVYLHIDETKNVSSYFVKGDQFSICFQL